MSSHFAHKRLYHIELSEYPIENSRDICSSNHVGIRFSVLLLDHIAVIKHNQLLSLPSMTLIESSVLLAITPYILPSKY